MAADGLDLVPGCAATFLIIKVGAGVGIAIAIGFLAWFVCTVLLRTISTQSLGGAAFGVRWRQPNGQDAGLGAHIGYATFGQAIVLVAFLWWAALYVIMPTRLFQPSSYTMFKTPNTPLFGVMAFRA